MATTTTTDLLHSAIAADTRHERITMDFPGRDKRTIFTPERIEVQTAAALPRTAVVAMSAPYWAAAVAAVRRARAAASTSRVSVSTS